MENKIIESVKMKDVESYISDCRLCFKNGYLSGVVVALEGLVVISKTLRDIGEEVVAFEQAKMQAKKKNRGLIEYWLDDLAKVIVENLPKQSRMGAGDEATKEKRTRIIDLMFELMKLDSKVSISETPQKWRNFIATAIESGNLMILKRWRDIGGRGDMVVSRNSLATTMDGFATTFDRVDGLLPYGHFLAGETKVTLPSGMFYPLIAKIMSEYWPNGVKWDEWFKSCAKESLENVDFQKELWNGWFAGWKTVLIGNSVKALEVKRIERMHALKAIVKFTSYRPGASWFEGNEKYGSQQCAYAGVSDRERNEAQKRWVGWGNRMMAEVSTIESNQLKKSIGLKDIPPSDFAIKRSVL